MLEIRKSQIDDLATDQELRYAKKYAPFFRASIGPPLDNFSDDDLRRRIAEILNNLRGLPIKEPGPYTQIVEMALLIGPDFETNPNIRASLNAEGLSDDEKVIILRRELPYSSRADGF